MKNLFAAVFICALLAPNAPAQTAAAAINGVYNGTYTVAQGPRTLKLALQTAPSGALNAVFTFYLPPASQTRGFRFSLNGTFDAASGKFSLRPVKWETPPPPNYDMVGMDGTFDPDSGRIAGKIIFWHSGTFQATRDPSQSVNIAGFFAPRPAPAPASPAAAPTPTAPKSADSGNPLPVWPEPTAAASRNTASVSLRTRRQTPVTASAPTASSAPQAAIAPQIPVMTSGLPYPLQIQAFDRMDGQDQIKYVDQLAQGAEDGSVGDPNLHAQIWRFFRPQASDTVPGMDRFQVDLSLARIADLEAVAKNPKSQRLDVANVMYVTFEKNGILLNKNFRPKPFAFTPEKPLSDHTLSLEDARKALAQDEAWWAQDHTFRPGSHGPSSFSSNDKAIAAYTILIGMAIVSLNSHSSSTNAVGEIDTRPFEVDTTPWWVRAGYNSYQSWSAANKRFAAALSGDL